MPISHYYNRFNCHFLAVLVSRVKACETPPFRPKVNEDACSPELYRIMIACWDELPQIRPTFDSINNSLRKQLK